MCHYAYFSTDKGRLFLEGKYSPPPHSLSLHLLQASILHCRVEVFSLVSHMTFSQKASVFVCGEILVGQYCTVQYIVGRTHTVITTFLFIP